MGQKRKLAKLRQNRDEAPEEPNCPSKKANVTNSQHGENTSSCAGLNKEHFPLKRHTLQVYPQSLITIPTSQSRYQKCHPTEAEVITRQMMRNANFNAKLDN
jgi:hypothetical protein